MQNEIITNEILAISEIKNSYIDETQQIYNLKAKQNFKFEKTDGTYVHMPAEICFTLTYENQTNFLTYGTIDEEEIRNIAPY